MLLSYNKKHPCRRIAESPLQLDVSSPRLGSSTGQLRSLFFPKDPCGGACSYTFHAPQDYLANLMDYSFQLCLRLIWKRANGFIFVTEKRKPKKKGERTTTPIIGFMNRTWLHKFAGRAAVMPFRWVDANSICWASFRHPRFIKRNTHFPLPATIGRNCERIIRRVYQVKAGD